ncbi:heparan-alpha-glucosaminide N-acetyltransferase [Jannaschia ovalis]|uniref:Heparan-alpha-glucosaminide N-acetyltransferase n=1 Tax=Jannaschia ovalis TaxID=3038773 RepID=A0ABY8LEH8_9RHOB|nr:heparan-alpha-glucosaminide N-acetyltransferase [Jannaschia sp. GRR-S6-38]WGH79718.1 heparan-alpha-glucosaminide N-acetyltransferase [Jannaschia sp. GRR-S6-38]
MSFVPAASGARLIAVDWLRGFALAHMVAFHFLYDLRLYGLAPDWMRYGAPFQAWAASIAGSFIFLAGLSLWLAHGRGFRARGYLRRLGMLVLAALAVSVATRIAVPGAWVRFGILHSIALSSLLGLAFLRAPAWATAAAGLAVLFALPALRDPAFDGLWWLWSGLGTARPPMIDYEPMVPWFGPFLLGLAFGQAGGAALLRWGPAAPGRLAAALAWPGRHALTVYLLHQPILIGAILGWSRLTG